MVIGYGLRTLVMPTVLAALLIAVPVSAAPTQSEDTAGQASGLISKLEIPEEGSSKEESNKGAVEADEAEANAAEAAAGDDSSELPKECRITVTGNDGREYKLACSSQTRIYRGEFPVAGLAVLKVGMNIRFSYLTREGDKERVTGNITEVRILDPAARGIWRNDLTFGVQFAQDRGAFSEQSAVLTYDADFLLARLGKRWRAHAFVRAGLLALPNEEAEQVSDPKPKKVSKSKDAGKFETFVRSRKSFAVGTGLYLVWELRNELDVGFIAQAGFKTFSTDDVDDAQGKDKQLAAFQSALVDNTYTSYAGGIRLAYHEPTPPSVNPRIDAYVNVMIGKFESFFNDGIDAVIAKLEAGEPVTREEIEAAQNATRIVFESQLRIPGSLPVYAGFLANLGRGRDDVRLFLTLQLDLDDLVSIGK